MGVTTFLLGIKIAIGANTLSPKAYWHSAIRHTGTKNVCIVRGQLRDDARRRGLTFQHLNKIETPHAIPVRPAGQYPATSRMGIAQRFLTFQKLIYQNGQSRQFISQGSAFYLIYSNLVFEIE